MARDETTKAIEALLTETGAAHHEAFLETDGADPEWALWYAQHLQKPLGEALGEELTQTDIVVCLVFLEGEHAASAPDEPWSAYYARRLVERYLPAAEERLALYHFDGCPYCRMVRGVIDELGVDVELRDIRENDEHRDALLAARGRMTVPVLRCTTDEVDRWMPESRDIVRYLRDRFG